MKVRTDTETFTLRAHRGDPQRLRELREELQRRFPDRVVTIGDALNVAVSSMSDVLAEIPRGATAPPPPEFPSTPWRLQGRPSGDDQAA